MHIFSKTRILSTGPVSSLILKATFLNIKCTLHSPQETKQEVLQGHILTSSVTEKKKVYSKLLEEIAGIHIV